MDSILFGTKRAFHATSGFARRVLAPFGITPSRLDILQALDSVPCQSMLQSRLRRWIGVSRATISRMLKAMEERGWIVRRRTGGDARTRNVLLTDDGVRLVRRVMRATVYSGVISLAIDSALCQGVLLPRRRLLEKDRCEGILRLLRRYFGDDSWFHYRWHPDD